MRAFPALRLCGRFQFHRDAAGGDARAGRPHRPLRIGAVVDRGYSRKGCHDRGGSLPSPVRGCPDCSVRISWYMRPAHACNYRGLCIFLPRSQSCESRSLEAVLAGSVTGRPKLFSPIPNPHSAPGLEVRLCFCCSPPRDAAACAVDRRRTRSRSRHRSCASA